MLRDPSLIPLSHQHHNGLALCVLTRRGLAADRSPANLDKCAARVVKRYEVELVNHFEIEEQVLFPLCEDRALIAGLLADHRAIEELIARLRETPSAELLERFCELLSTHIRREEKDLFERLQADLPRELLDRAGRDIDRRVVRVCL